MSSRGTHIADLYPELDLPHVPSAAAIGIKYEGSCTTQFIRGRFCFFACRIYGGRLVNGE